jgi:ABC-type phosphate transport system substrate-binding protein
LNKEKIIDIYTLNSQNWDDGSRIIVFDYKGEDDTKTKFYNNLDFTFAKMQKEWLRKQFSGAGMPPQTFRDYKEIVDKVSITPGAVAYVPSRYVTKDIAVVATFTD